jgi:hypothetical protein
MNFLYLRHVFWCSGVMKLDIVKPRGFVHTLRFLGPDVDDSHSFDMEVWVDGESDMADVSGLGATSFAESGVDRTGTDVRIRGLVRSINPELRVAIEDDTCSIPTLERRRCAGDELVTDDRNRS